MASDTNTRNKNKVDSPGHPEKSRAGGLTLRILSVNVVAPIVLVLGLLYMGQYRDSLIHAELETLKIQARLFAGAVAEGAVQFDALEELPRMYVPPEESETLDSERARRMVRRLGETMSGSTRLFDHKGQLVADSQELVGPGGVVHLVPLGPPQNNLNLSEIFKDIGNAAIDMLPAKSALTPYPQIESADIRDYPDAERALNGTVGASAWKGKNGEIILTASAPVQKVKKIQGVVLLTQQGTDIESAMAQVRFDVLTVFLGALSITIFMSIYLAGLIGRPLTKLALAAETIRQNKGRAMTIPDMSNRRDEIGELSKALRDMTYALWNRMDTIERFAADVSHEIKNPLTSLRSAVETAQKVKNEKDREQLMEIIQHDVQRLDRLISDISSASRLDAELSRDEMGDVNLHELLDQLVKARQKPLTIGDGKERGNIILNFPARQEILVRGNESRLVQVFDNLIGNALSFSPSGKSIEISVFPHREKGEIHVKVEDEGPGIPENKLETIFERFYSERPRHEDYGSHSGLGLSISKQIIAAHDGDIFAENLYDKDRKVKGACFTVVLKAA